MLFPRVYLCRHVTNTSLNIVTQPLSEASGSDTFCPSYRHNRRYCHKIPRTTCLSIQFAPLDTHFKNPEPELVFKAANQTDTQECSILLKPRNWLSAGSIIPPMLHAHLHPRIVFTCGTNLLSLGTSKKSMLSSSRQEIATPCALRYKNWNGVTWTSPGII